MDGLVGGLIGGWMLSIGRWAKAIRQFRCTLRLSSPHLDSARGLRIVRRNARSLVHVRVSVPIAGVAGVGGGAGAGAGVVGRPVQQRRKVAQSARSPVELNVGYVLEEIRFGGLAALARAKRRQIVEEGLGRWWWVGERR